MEFTLRFGLDDAWVADDPMAGELRELTLALLTPGVVIVAVDIGTIVAVQRGSLERDTTGDSIASVDARLGEKKVEKCSL